ncbi:MAG: PH domain-containing protein, partial [Spirochaetota bacterium]
LISLFLRKSSAVRKAIGIGVVVVVLGAVVWYTYRPVIVRVHEDGIEVEGAGGLELEWDDVESAVFEPNLPTSPFRPTVRTTGVAIGDYRTGRFLLSNGDRARVFTEQSQTAVLIRTSELAYLFAPVDAEALAEAIDTHRVYEEGDGDD